MTFTKYISVLLLLLSNIAFAQTKFEAKLDSRELKDEVFIITELSEANLSISDSLTVRYKLYVSQNTGIENWKEVGEPIYTNFEINYLKPDGIEIKNEKYSGETYRTVILREVVLKPNKKGNLILPEYTLDIDISTPPSKKDVDVFGRLKLKKQNITITTDEIKLTVK